MYDPVLTVGFKPHIEYQPRIITVPKIIKPLTALQVSRISRSTAVGGVPGLELRIADPDNYKNSRTWIVRYTRPDGTRSGAGLGSYPAIGLEEARERASAVHALVRQGIDPATRKEEAKVEAEEKALLNTTFRDAALELLTINAKGWKKKKRRDGEQSITSVSEIQWMGTFTNTLFPVLGDMRCGAIEPRHVLNALEPIWYETPVAADRALQRCKDVMAFTVEKGYRKAGVNPADHANFRTSLPKRGRAKPKSHAAMAWQQVPDFMTWLATEPRGRIGNYAMRFCVLTAARAANVVFATWGQFELDGQDPHWLVPEGELKGELGGDQTHYVPLATQAVRLLRELRNDPNVMAHGIGPNDLVFPSVYNNYARSNTGPLTTAALLNLGKQYAGDEITTHGFRSTFTDWGTETFGSNDQKALDLCLAHVEENKVRRAYLRTEMRERRREIMQQWADFAIPEYIVQAYQDDTPKEAFVELHKASTESSSTPQGDDDIEIHDLY